MSGLGEFFADGLMLGVFGLACVLAGDAVHRGDWFTVLCALMCACVIVPLILRSMAADHYTTGAE